LTANPKSLVADGYNHIADAYLDRFGASSVREKWLGRLANGLPSVGGQVLDPGCGAGIPVARDLAALGHSVLGVDGSVERVAWARRNVPSARFIHADMCDIQFDAGSFDGVGAFYSITHVPAAEQPGLIAKIARWLRPCGTFVASFGAGRVGDWTDEWLGTTMFFGHISKEATHKYLSDAGLVVRESQVEQQDNEDAAFPWISAVKQARISPSSAERQVNARFRQDCSGIG
jgi:SAM-dependent methyltransferase